MTHLICLVPDKQTKNLTLTDLSPRLKKNLKEKKKGGGRGINTVNNNAKDRNI